MNFIRTLYLYILSFISLGMIIFGTAFFVNNIVLFYFPDSYVFFEETHKNDYYDDNNLIDFNNYDYDYNYHGIHSNKSNYNQIKKENYKNDKIKNSIVGLVIVIIGIIMYRYHWGTISKKLE